jgi:hypothetical protein
VGNRFQVCSICKNGPDVVGPVNQAIAAKEKFRDLAARTGFSSSALWRHSKKCIPRAALAERKNKSSPIGGRTVVSWPAQPHTRAHLSVMHSQEIISPADVRPDDVVFLVSYSSALPLSDYDAERNRRKVSARLVDEALREDSIRFPKSSIIENAS